jgi:DNA-directed RNA polymerase specialized sigma24 family protein
MEVNSRDELSGDRLTALLNWLGDPAGGTYEDLRLRLVRFFIWRDCLRAEECADITIDRIARRVDAGEVTGIADPWLYCHAVARNVLREYWRDPSIRSQGLPPNAPAEPVRPNLEPHLHCLEKCMEGLSSETRDLVIRYHRSSGGEKVRVRREMAESLGVPINALRIRMWRVRGDLARCIEKCLKKSDMESDFRH